MHTRACTHQCCSTLNCLRLKDGDQGLPAEVGRAGKHSSESKEAELDFANKAYTLAKRAQEQARERKEKQKAREDIDSRIRCNQAQHAVCAPLRLCVCDFVRARIVCLCVCSHAQSGDAIT